jgi:alpha-glucuronidase
MYNNIETCPQELLLFFHNLAWTHPVALGNGTMVPLIDYSERSAGRLLSLCMSSQARAVGLRFEIQICLTQRDLPNVGDVRAVAITSEHALAEARAMGASWDGLEGLVDAERFAAVQGRFRQQNVDALAFSEVIVGYYLNMSKGSQIQMVH